MDVTIVLLLVLSSTIVCKCSPLNNIQYEENQNFDLNVRSLITGSRVANWNEDQNINVEELGEYFQGDIILEKSKNGLLNETFRWQDGVVPYEIVGSFNQTQLDLINEAFELYHTKSCIKFRPKTNEDVDYISIDNDDSGCWSYVGKKGGKQVVNLQSPGCVKRIGTPVHELLHALGFYHEQSRHERDEYVIIVWDNIEEGKEHNFDKYNEDTVSGFGVGYDYESVMHYSSKAFSANGLPTIVPMAINVTLGQRDGFSAKDIMKLNNMYKCSKKEETPKSL